MCTLYINFPFPTFINTYRIEADNLHQGIEDRLMLHMCRYSEILKFIVDKDEVMISSLRLNVLQSIRKRNITEVMTNALCTNK